MLAPIRDHLSPEDPLVTSARLHDEGSPLSVVVRPIERVQAWSES